MTAIAQAWQDVSDANAVGWSVLAAAMSPKMDPDGFMYDLNAQMAYTIVNAYRLLAGEAQDPVAPTYTLPAAPGIATVGYDHTLHTLRVDFDGNIAQSGFAFLQTSGRIYSLRRTARANEVFLPDEDPSACFAVATVDTAYVEWDTTTFRFIPAAAERRGIRITYLDANYLPGQIDFETIEFGYTA
ncbi:hypothetical protein ES703_52670 [subsurface metagenome]